MYSYYIAEKCVVRTSSSNRHPDLLCNAGGGGGALLVSRNIPKFNIRYHIYTLQCGI